MTGILILLRQEHELLAAVRTGFYCSSSPFQLAFSVRLYVQICKQTNLDKCIDEQTTRGSFAIYPIRFGFPFSLSAVFFLSLFPLVSGRSLEEGEMKACDIVSFLFRKTSGGRKEKKVQCRRTSTIFTTSPPHSWGKIFQHVFDIHG